MRVFASNYLEKLSAEQVVPTSQWIWTPTNPNVAAIYASGSKTATKQSTYATEKDHESDSDRPNEGK